MEDLPQALEVGADGTRQMDGTRPGRAADR
jgi:hypothetical protein